MKYQHCPGLDGPGEHDAGVLDRDLQVYFHSGYYGPAGNIVLQDIYIEGFCTSAEQGGPLGDSGSQLRVDLIFDFKMSGGAL